MNLEQLCKDFKSKYHLIKNKKTAWKFLRFQFLLMRWKKNKLKLGLIFFEMKTLTVGGFTLLQAPEMRYIRQDTTISDEQKLETQLEKIKWHWNWYNYGALLVVLFCFYFYLRFLFSVFFHSHIAIYLIPVKKISYIMVGIIKLFFSTNLYNTCSFYNQLLYETLVQTTLFFF